MRILRDNGLSITLLASFLVLLLAQAEGRDPASFTGSFAGALGLGQFMPSSWRAYARDFDGDGHIDLMGNPADAVGSIANFLQQHGWRPGQHTHRSLAHLRSSLNPPRLGERSHGCRQRPEGCGYFSRTRVT